MATNAAAALSRCAYIVESTWGTTPATPTFLPLRVLDAGIRTNKKTQAIQEIAAHRNVADEIQTSQGGSAAYKFALSYATFDDIMSSALMGAWATNVLKVGASHALSMTFEETLQLNGSLSFSRLTGGMVDTFDLDITAGAGINGAFTVKGQKETLDTAIISGATYTAANTKTPMAAGLGVASLSVLGLTTPAVRRVALSIKNGLRDRFVIDSNFTQEFGEGLCEVTGTIEMYFKSNAHYQKVLDHGSGDLTMTLGTTTTEKYTIDMPACIFLDGARVVGGVGSDVMVNVPFRAKYDSGSASSISITRAVA